MNLYTLLVIYNILLGCACWITTSQSLLFNSVISVLVIIVWYYRLADERREITQPVILAMVGAFILNAISTKMSMLHAITSSITMFSLCTPMLLSSSVQSYLLDKINKVFYVLIIVSICFYALNFIGKLPVLSLVQRGHYFYNNYLIYLYSPDYDFKFCGFCWEPGFMSLLLSALLLINDFDISKRCCKLYLLALVLTFSLGGYILASVCYLLYITLIKNEESKSLIGVSSSILFFLLIIYFIQNIWNNGDNVVNHLIFEKFITTYSESSLFEMRQNGEALVLWDSFIGGSSKWFGIGTDAYNDFRANAVYYDAASITQFMITCGIIGTIINILIIAKTTLSNHKYKYAIPGFVFLLLDFIQHGYGISSSMFILVLLWISYSSNKEDTTDEIEFDQQLS